MEQETEQVTLNLNDLKLMAQVIKVVSARGAIQAEEMAAVGILYTKLLGFIKAAEPEEAAANAAAEASSEAPAGETEGN